MRAAFTSAVWLGAILEEWGGAQSGPGDLASAKHERGPQAFKSLGLGLLPQRQYSDPALGPEPSRYRNEPQSLQFGLPVTPDAILWPCTAIVLRCTYQSGDVHSRPRFSYGQDLIAAYSFLPD